MGIDSRALRATLQCRHQAVLRVTFASIGLPGTAAPAAGAPAVRLLHAPCLILSNGAMHTLERKDAALLAMLATEGPWSAARAASLLWPDSADAQARANLRQRLFRLRQLAGVDLVSSHATLRLAPGLAVDVLQFQHALLDDPGVGAGDLLGSHDYGDTGALEQWVTAARERWRRQRSEYLAARASEFEREQKIAAALVLAQRLVADDPLHEHAQRRVMRLHYLRGDRSAALAAFQHCRDVLQGELGVQPSAETTQLAALIEASDTLPDQAPAPPTQAFRLLTKLRPPQLIGREAPWLQLEQARRHAAVVLLEGEAGIGKTRLLNDFAAAHGNAPVFGGRPGDAALPYALLARIVRGLAARWPLRSADAAAWVLPELARLAPELGAPAAGQLSVLRLQQALLQALTEWQRAGLDLLVIDDLHHADCATLELLPALAAGLREPGIAWLLGVRHGELPAPAARWLAAPDLRALDQIKLGPLDLDGVQALLASLALPGLDAARWAPVLTQRTGGNPLFLLETLIALIDKPGSQATPLAGDPPPLPAPERIAQLIEQRLARLSPSALKLARIAAIAGPDFSASLAAQVLGMHALDIADSWRELEAAGVIRDVVFANDMLFEGTLRSIPQPLLCLLHRDIAEALQASGAPAARLAAHWSAAKRWAHAGDAFVAAARAAYAVSRRVEEAQLWDDAVRCFEMAGQADKAFDARRDSIDTALATRTAESVLRQTASLRRAARNDTQRLDALLADGKALLTAGQRRDAMPVADAAVKLARRIGGPQQRLDATRLAALCQSPGPRAADGIAALRSLAAWVEADGNPMRRRDYYCDLTVAMQLAGRRSEAAALYPLAIAAAHAIGDVSDELTMTSNLGGLLGQLGRVQAGHAQAEQACRLLDRVGDPDGVAAAASLMSLGAFEAMLGRLDLSLQHLEKAWGKLGNAGGTTQHAACETQFANLWLQLGQPARALQALRPIAAEAVAQMPQRQGRRLTMEARIARALGRSALPHLQRAMKLFGPDTEPFLRMLTELDRSRELAPEEALSDCMRVRDEAQALELLAVEMRARLLSIEALGRAGKVVQAAAEARAAAESWHACRPADLYWPEALWIGYQALRDDADDEAAQAILDEAVQWIHHTAGPNVPAPFRSGFRYRNAVNRAILTVAGNRAAAM